MSWSTNDFDRHGGRNAFRNSDDFDSDAAGRASSLRAMRSFTESVESDFPPAPELPPTLDIDHIGLKTSDTSDTIIEVVKENSSSPKPIDPSMGETQKYKMVVPGPGHSEQEQELHKSLIAHEEDEVDAEIEHVMAAAAKREPPSSFMRHVPDAEHQALRREYSNSTVQRRRPTTPTSACAIETLAFVAPEGSAPSGSQDKIKVSIPTGRRRKSDMPYSDFYDSMTSNLPSQMRASFSGRVTPLHDYDGDIIDEAYKDKAPPVPVVHRRASADWESFDEVKDRPPQPPPPTNGSMNKEEDEEPQFSEEMQEERRKLREASEATSAVAEKPPSPMEISEQAATEQLVPEASAENAETAAEVPEAASSNGHTETTEHVEEQQQAHQVEGEHHDHQEHGGYEYDPNAYPGYIWNYEKQEWEVDPNYVHPETSEQQYDYSQNDQTTVAESTQYGYDQPSDSQFHAGYDQLTDGSTTTYDYTTAAYHEGYDQPEANTSYANYDYNYDQYHGQGYDYSQSGENQQQADYSQHYQQGYDYSQQDQTSSNYDYQQGQDYNHRYYDQQQDYNYNQEQQTYNYEQGQQYNYDPQQYDQSYGGEQSHGQENGYHQEAYQAEQPSAVEEPATVSEHHVPAPSRPPPPPPAVPLFQSAPSHEQNPFSWEGQHAHEVPAHEGPSRPPPPSRPEPSAPPAQEETSAAVPPPRPPAARPPPPRPNVPHPAKLPETEEKDAWSKFNEMTARVQEQIAQSGDTMKKLEETTAVKDLKDESYLASVGGVQGYVDNTMMREIQKKKDQQAEAKVLKKKLKQQGKKAASPTFDPDEEDSMDKKAQELAAQLAAKMGMQNFTPPATKQIEQVKREDSFSAIPPRKRSSLKETQQDSGGSLELPAHLSAQQRDSISIAPKGDLEPGDPMLTAPAWADFESSEPVLPPSESGFFKKEDASAAADPFVTSVKDPFAPNGKSLIEEDYDPFAVQSVEEIVASAKAKAEEARQAAEARDDVDFFGAGRQSPDISTPTPEGGSPASTRPQGFEDDFQCEVPDGETPTPLYDEDDSQPLADFIPKFTCEGWQLMIRHPIKKKSFMAERCWKPCFVRLQQNTLLVFNSKEDNKPIQELLLQATYSLSDTTLQAYDIYGKIHTVKLQYVQYKEKVGIRPGQISRLVEGHVTKYGLPLEHSAQCNVLLKFGSLDAAELQSFVGVMEDVLFRCPIRRETKPVYKQDEVQVHCYDEYAAYVDKDGIVSDQKARVRLFCLAFVTGSPFLEIGLNDRRRQGKEIVRRKDILPMYTERWIRFENLEFHNTVDRPMFDQEQVIRLSPPDGCFFEIMRFRVRPPRNKEKALTIKAIMKIAGSKVEIRIETMAAAQIQKEGGGRSTRRQIPCEDIAIRFPIPEAWIYIFREERHWGVGSVHSKKLRPGKVKNLKDRLLGAVQSSEPNLIEVAIGEAKYEHVYRSLVWRIPRLPEKHHSAYKAHLLRCRFELSSFDLMPETFLPRCDVDFTMPLATVSNTVIRSVSVEQHEDSDRVEKFVRYVAKCQYKVEIDYVQCADLEVDTMDPTMNPEAMMTTIPELHKPQFHPDDVHQMHEGYRIDLPERDESARPKDDSSSDDDDDKPNKMPIIQIDMKNYGY